MAPAEPAQSATGSANGSAPAGDEAGDAAADAPIETFETPAVVEQDAKSQPLDERWQQWLLEIDPLITSVERRFFLQLDEDYEREAFQRQFWAVRDPYPRTVRNEMKERWPVRVAEARAKWQSLTDDRSRLFMVHGPPGAAFRVKCTQTRYPAEMWIYDGTDWTDVQVALIFLADDFGKGEAKIWRPTTSGMAAEAALNRLRNCINGAQVLQAAQLIQAHSDNYEVKVARLLVKPRPSSTEWLDTFQAFSTDLAADAEPLDADVELAFPGRHQHRTVMQGMVELASDDVATGEYAGYRSHDFRLTGEVIKDDVLFESFRYQFGFAADTAPETLPLAFQRFLRPGDYRLVLKLDDLHSKKAWRHDFEVTVPRTDEAFEVVSYTDPQTEELFREVAEAVAAGEDGIRIVPPQDDLLTGFVRFDTLLAGDAVEKVRFYLDDKLVLTKNRAPFDVRLDLGPYPDVHTLRVEGLDADGELVADDDLIVNSGGYRFILDLREPRPGKTYDQSLRARAEVEVPEGRSIDRVEFFLDETKVATLYQEPWVQPIVLPRAGAPGYVRAVAYLADGNTTEDLVFFNSPDYLDELEIQFVELYTTVLDSTGRPVAEDLEKSDFRILEDGQPQQITRFERVKDLPIHVAVLIDSSASMVGTLEEVKRAALSFFQQAIGPKDRAAVIPFSTFPTLAVELTNDTTALGSGLAGLAPEGQTALYDSIMYALYYFAGVKGQRAMLVLSDGRDESSRFDFDATLEYARRAGVTIYPIGFQLGDPIARSRLARLAEETGGTAHFLRDIEELAPVYTAIQRELRSQLLIAYQSTNTDEESGFRRIELEVDRPGVEVKTLSGYYP